MNLLIMTNVFPPATGGASIYVDILTRYLVRKPGIKKIIVLTRFFKKAPIIENRDKIKILRLLCPRIEPGFLPQKVRGVIPLLIDSLVPFFVIPLFRIDIVHDIHYFNFWIPRIYRVPVIMDNRGMARQEYKAMGLYADAGLSISRDVLAEPTKLYAKGERVKARYIPMPFEPPKRLEPPYIQRTKEKYGIPLNFPYLCFAAPIRAFKGIYELTDAFDIFLRTHPEYYLVLIGKSFEGERLERKIKDNGHIIHIGSVPHNEAMAIIQGSEMLVQPSEEASGYIPRSLLEAIALGRKVILPPNVQDAGKYCPDFVLDEVTPQAITSKIEKVLKLNRKPEVPLEEFAPEKVVNEIYELYEELIANRGQ